MAKSDCVRCIHSVVCKHRSRNEQPWVEEHCKLAAREERPHGEWLKKDTYFGTCWATCSVCNKVSRGEAHDNGFGHDYSYPNFCPNCGADMRGEAE